MFEIQTESHSHPSQMEHRCLVLTITTVTADHDGYCSGSENDIDIKTRTECIWIPESLRDKPEGDIPVSGLPTAIRSKYESTGDAEGGGSMYCSMPYTLPDGFEDIACHSVTTRITSARIVVLDE